MRVRLGNAGAFAVFAATSLANAQCQIATLDQIDPNADNYGGACSFDGQTALAVENSFDAIGLLRVFTKTGGSWSLAQSIPDPYQESLSGFGIAADIHGDWFVTSSPSSSLIAPGQGAVFVYHHGNGGWSLAQEIRPDFQTAYLGYSVRFNDQTLVASAPATPIPGVAEAGTGCVVFYSHTKDGWGAPQQIFPPTSPANTYFGKQIALVGDRAYVSQHPIAVHEYTRKGGEWTHTHTFVPPSPATTSPFGWSIDAGEDLLVAGAPYSEVHGESSGKAIAFRRVNGVWDTGEDLEPPVDGFTVDSAGESCAVVAQTGDVLVGAPYSNGGGVFFSGRVLRFRFVDGHWTYLDDLTPQSPLPFSNMGWNIAVAGEQALVARFTAPVLFTGLDPVDCNGNGVPDGCDLAERSSLDLNGNGIPDECELPGDLDGDGAVGPADLAILLGAWGPCSGACGADLVLDRHVDQLDLATLLGLWSS